MWLTGGSYNKTVEVCKFIEAVALLYEHFQRGQTTRERTNIPVSLHHAQIFHSVVLVLSVLYWLQEQQI